MILTNDLIVMSDLYPPPYFYFSSPRNNITIIYRTITRKNPIGDEQETGNP